MTDHDFPVYPDFQYRKIFSTRRMKDIFPEITKDFKYRVWLDSSGAIKETGEWSFIVSEPDFIVWKNPGENGVVHRLDFFSGQERHRTVCSTFIAYTEELAGWNRKLMESVKIQKEFLDPEKFPFIAGFTGYFGYEIKNELEDLTEINQPDNLPEAFLIFSPEVLGFRHSDQTYHYFGLQKTNSSGSSEFSKRVERIFSGEPDKTEDPGNSDPVPVPEKIGILKNEDPAASGFRSSLGMEDYKNAFDRIKESINNGIVYQACLTVSFWKDYSGYALSDYLEIREINPVPFGAFLETPMFRILSFSPERFFSLRDGHIESRPMKGTRIRLNDPQEDVKLIGSLTRSEKDNAENSMIVDLIRNDIGKVSELGTVRVEKIHQIESYKTVFQLTSILSGKLRKNLDISHLLSAIFPGGSMTGVPKISALNLINELERSPRGIYSGCFGYMDIRGGADFSIVIRTAISYDNKIKLQSGGGIVFDSILEEEWNELIGKSAFLLNYFGNKKEF